MSEQPLTVLVVDDEAPALADLSRLLRSAPGTGAVCTAASGPEALRTLAERPFDAVFLDVRMPGLDGLELARVLRRFEESPAIVFVSACETGAVDAFELKALDYLMKPVSGKRLAEALNPNVREARGAVSTRPDDVVPLPTLREGTRLVQRDSILFLQADGDYVRVICDEERFLMRGRVSGWPAASVSTGSSRCTAATWPTCAVPWRSAPRQRHRRAGVLGRPRDPRCTPSRRRAAAGLVA